MSAAVKRGFNFMPSDVVKSVGRGAWGAAEPGAGSSRPSAAAKVIGPPRLRAVRVYEQRWKLAADAANAKQPDETTRLAEVRRAPDGGIDAR